MDNDKKELNAWHFARWHFFLNTHIYTTYIEKHLWNYKYQKEVLLVPHEFD